MKRIQSRLGLLAFLALAGFAFYLWLAPSGGINRLSVLRIKAGMSPEAVETMIGLPPGNYRTDSDDNEARLYKSRLRYTRLYFFGYGETHFWHGDTGTIVVRFDEKRKVTERSFVPFCSSIFDRLYQWIGVDDK